ncbi:MAG: type II toxin-antitoxin system RelE/ParE family toxin [Candidatus Acidiferrales bacterium]
MRFRALKSFERDHAKLPRKIQEQFEKAIHLFETNPRHPSLRVKKMRGTHGIWEASLTMSYRFTFNWEGDVVTFRRVGAHDILRMEE